ncbi:hypothetical protein M0805_002370 [Coniferiporia weirii]|nr:hypothetical protein M0805_002370 [Coniferiporia weirii]
MSFRYYQPPKPSRADTESEYDSSEDGTDRRYGRRNSGNPGSQPSKRGACTHCKGLKVKCHFSAGQGSCQRCIINKLQCVVNGRKKRRAVATHEELLLKSHKQDLEIVNLLRQFDELTTDKRVQSWIDKANLKNPSSSPISHHSLSSSHSSNTERDRSSWTSSYGYGELGAPYDQNMDTNASYLSSPTSQFPGSSKDKYSVQELLSYFPDASVTAYTKAPEIIARGIIHPGDVAELFLIYFKFINPYFSLLDPVLHTPEKLFWHSHFLFTMICCVATQHSPKYAPMVSLFVEFVHDLSGKTLVQGRKTVDECQAFLIQSVYQMPRKRFEDQRGWLTMGLAFSLAHELRLNEPPSTDHITDLYSTESMDSKDGFAREMVERERLNRIRTWLNCYCVDASHATQFGKPAMLDVEDYIARNCKDWYRSSPFNLSIDVHLVAYVEISRTMRHFRIEVEQVDIEEREHPSRPKKIKEVLEIVDNYHNELWKLHVEWSNRFASHPRHDEYMCSYRADTNRMINAFNRLVVLFYGLQRVVAAKKGEEGAGASKDDKLVRQCVEAAKEVIKGMIYKLYPTGMLRYSMEAHFLFVTFAAAHLLSLLRPKMAILLCPGDLEEIDYLVRGLVEVLRSKDVSKGGSGRRAPILYARYLANQLKKFSSVLPRLPGGNRTATSQDSTMGTSHDFAPRSSSGIGTGAHTWTGLAELPSEATRHGIIPHTALNSQSNQESGGSRGAVDDAQLYQLSEYALDFSLVNFLHTVNEPQFAKATPPPDEPEEPSQWWQQMYPASNQVPDACEWPMVLDNQPPIPVNGQKQHFIPEY